MTKSQQEDWEGMKIVSSRFALIPSLQEKKRQLVMEQ